MTINTDRFSGFNVKNTWIIEYIRLWEVKHSGNKTRRYFEIFTRVMNEKEK